MANPIDVQKALAGESYPASKSDLIEKAKENGADQSLVDDLDKLPDREYSGPDQVQKALF
ncbi:MAG: hypothetical protein JWR37_5999 [Mycobacterium sp.]|jgi:hypothetical protein|nr:hypothetical protein [Mycobacterium sp.]